MEMWNNGKYGMVSIALSYYLLCIEPDEVSLAKVIFLEYFRFLTKI